MRQPARHPWLARVAAFVAVALLSLASAQSAVMQAAAVADPTSPWPICSVGAGKTGSQAPADKAAHVVCAVCAAAACAPLAAAGPSLQTPRAAAWSPDRPIASPGVPGPPRFHPKARGPPSFPLTV